MFLKLGIRVIAIDCVGYGRTVGAWLRSCSGSLAKTALKESPDTSMEPYTVKSTANDIVTLAGQLGYNKIILGGHDWYVHLKSRLPDSLSSQVITDMQGAA